MKKIYTSGFFVFLTLSALLAQVPQKVVLEHFTNTLCSICASRNPSLLSNLEANPQIMHLTIHPSRPYSNCVLSQHNKKEQDNRTKAYDIFGSTPRIVIQGNVIASNTDYSKSSIFDAFNNKTSPASVRIEQAKFGRDSIQIRVVVKTEATHSLGKLTLFAAVVEDTIFYNAPNGEKEHYNVFRKTFSNDVAPEFELPAAVGDSVVFTLSSAAHVDWDFDHIYAMAMVQELAGMVVVQVEATTASQNDLVMVGTSKPAQVASFSLYPNPTKNMLNTTKLDDYSIFEINGHLIAHYESTNKIDVSALKEGVYCVRNSSGEISRFVK